MRDNGQKQYRRPESSRHHDTSVPEQTFASLHVCGLTELADHATSGLTDILSIIDPDQPDPPQFAAYPASKRTVLRFHDEIFAREAIILPEEKDILAILAFGETLHEQADDKHILVHCHMGMSRSAAAMVILLAQANPSCDEHLLFDRLNNIRGRSWPNSRMIAMADRILGREGKLTLAMRHYYGHQLRAFPQYSASLYSIGRGTEVEMAITPDEV